VIDLRSDTVTRPSPAMRAAMAAALVGDDGYAEDPTVQRLESLAAAMMGMEAGLLMPSGTMSNLVAALVHCPPDRGVIVMDNSHIGHTLTQDPRVSRLTNVVPVQSTARGVFDDDALLAGLNGTKPGLVCLENSHNMASGAAIHPAEARANIKLARERGLPVHLDGARIFNAAVALQLPVVDLTADVDSVTFCLSKGLGAPVGSVLCGSSEFIEKARSQRYYLGGTMRQAGVVAAAGIVALETMVDRLVVDHDNAKVMAAGLATIPGVALVRGPVETNLVFFDVAGTGQTAEEIEVGLNARGVRTDAYVKETIKRAVTHVDVNRADCLFAVEALRQVVTEHSLSHRGDAR
jgi:threonine aldolase